MADGGHFEKNSQPKSLWARYFMIRWVDRIQIVCSGSLGISDDLLTFGNSS